ncbi:hypothetical protein ABW20_dc0105726 [Dactylellina cionopaga]|nr:hypothetical protein ABW20_dc0105726 [Dactylellina cionopaga]
MKAPSILWIGLTSSSKYIPPSIDRNALHALLDSSLPPVTAAGFDAEVLLFEPEDISVFEAKLKEKSWDAVIIGFGVRGNPPLTEHFEALVNIVREHDANIKLGFNSQPADTVDVAKRLFPNVAPLSE